MTRARRTTGSFFGAIAPAVAAMGFLSALVVLETPAAIVAFVVLSGLLYPVTAWVVNRQRGEGETAYLRALVLWALGVRFLAFGLVRSIIDPVIFAPDAFTYESFGWAAAEALQGRGEIPFRMVEDLQVAYFWFNAVLFSVFGRTPEAPSTVNLFVSVWTAIVIYRLCRLAMPDRPLVARIAAALFAFFPSIVLWSVLNIREAPMIFLLTLSVLLFLRIQRRPSPVDLPLVIATLGLMLLYRQYMAILVGVSAIVGLMISYSRTPRRALVIGVLVMVIGTLAAQSLGWGEQLTADPTLDEIQMLREDMARGAGSAFVGQSDVSTVGGALSFLPIGLTYFLFAPFPWALGSALQVITLPETLIWYALVPFGLIGTLLVIRRRLADFAVPIFVTGAVTFSYALVQGNVGTAFRHRAQILPLLLVLVAVGLVLWTERRQRKRALRTNRIAQARAELRVGRRS